MMNFMGLFKKENTNDENVKKVRKKIFKMILPITGENILEMSMGFISMAMIGHLGEIAIGSIGISNRITSIIWALFKGISTGAAVFVSQAYGACNYKKLRNVIKQTLLSCIILVILAQQYIYWNASKILKYLFNPSKDLLSSSTGFLRIVSIGLPFFIILVVIIGILQGMGNAKTPFFITLIMNAFNVLLSWMLIFGHLGFSPLGLKGAAIATVISSIIGGSISLYVLFNKNGILHSKLNKDFFKLDITQINEIYKMGLPSSMESIFWQLASIILTRIMLEYGNAVLAAYQLGLQAESISYTPAIGFGVASTTFIGQCIGAKKAKEGKLYLKEIMKGSMLITSFNVLLLVFFPKLILLLLTNDKKIITLAAKYLIIMGLVQIPQNASSILNGALRGAGHTKVPMIVSGIGLWGFRIPASLILVYIFKADIVYVWIAMGIDLIIRFLLSLSLYKSKKIYNIDTVLD